MHFLGMAGVPRRYYRFDSFEAFSGFDDMNKFITIAAIITFFAQILFVVNFFWSMYRGKKVESQNPWGSNSLEWTTPIEAGHGNWPGKIPTVQRWAYDYGKDGIEFTQQHIPLREGEEQSSH